MQQLGLPAAVSGFGRGGGAGGLKTRTLYPTGMPTGFHLKSLMVPLESPVTMRPSPPTTIARASSTYTRTKHFQLNPSFLSASVDPCNNECFGCYPIEIPFEIPHALNLKLFNISGGRQGERVEIERFSSCSRCPASTAPRRLLRRLERGKCTKSRDGAFSKKEVKSLCLPLPSVTRRSACFQKSCHGSEI